MDADVRRHDSSATGGLPDDQVEAGADELSDPPPMQLSNSVENELEDALRLIPQALASTARATMATNVGFCPPPLAELQETNVDLSPDFEFFHDSNREYIQLPDHLSPMDPTSHFHNTSNHLPTPQHASFAVPLSPPHDPLQFPDSGGGGGGGGDSPALGEQLTSAQPASRMVQCDDDNSNGLLMEEHIVKTVSTTDARRSSHQPALTMSDHGSTVVNEDEGRSRDLCRRLSESNLATCLRASQDVRVETAVCSTQPMLSSQAPILTRDESTRRKTVGSRSCSSRRSKQSALNKRPRPPRNNNTSSTKPTPPIKIAPRSTLLTPSENCASAPGLSSAGQKPAITVGSSRFPSSRSPAMQQRRNQFTEETQRQQTGPTTDHGADHSSVKQEVLMTSMQPENFPKPFPVSCQLPHSHQSQVPAPALQQGQQLPPSQVPIGMGGNVANMFPIIPPNLFPLHPMMFSPAHTPPPPTPASVVDKNRQPPTSKDLKTGTQPLSSSSNRNFAQPNASGSVPVAHSNELENSNREKVNPSAGVCSSQAQTSMQQPLMGSQATRAFFAQNMLPMMPQIMFDPTVYFRMAQQFAFQPQMMASLPSVNPSPHLSSSEHRNRPGNVSASPIVGLSTDDLPPPDEANAYTAEQNPYHDVAPAADVPRSPSVEASPRQGNSSSGSIAASISADVGAPSTNRPVTMSTDGIQRELPRQPAARLDRHPVLGRLQLSNAARATIKGTSRSSGAADGMGSSQGSSARIEPLRPGTLRGNLSEPLADVLRLDKVEEMVKPITSPVAPVNESAKSGEPRVQKKRLVWTPELHERFVRAIDVVGPSHAVPKTLVTIMNVDGLTTEHVKSHLQKYRNSLRKEADEEACASVGNGLMKATSVQAIAESKSPGSNDLKGCKQEGGKSCALDEKGTMVVHPPLVSTLSESSKIASGTGDPSPKSRWSSMAATPKSLGVEYKNKTKDNGDMSRLRKRMSVDEKSSGDPQRDLVPRDIEASDGNGETALSPSTTVEKTEDKVALLVSDNHAGDSNEEGQRDLELELVKEKTLQLQLQLQMMVHRTIALERKLQQEHEKKKTSTPTEREESERSGRSAVGMLDYSESNKEEGIEKVAEIETDNGDDNADDSGKAKVEHKETTGMKRKNESSNSIGDFEINPLSSILDTHDDDAGRISSDNGAHGVGGDDVGQVDSKRQRKSQDRMTGDEELAELKSQQLEMRKQLELTTALLDVQLRGVSSSAINVTKRATQKT